MVNTRRYWDGQQWTEHRQEVAPREAQSVSARAGSRSTARPGETLAGVLFAVALPIIGLLIGLGMLRRAPGAGALVSALSVVGFLGWYVVLTRTG
jgi:hypothetical protein